MKSSLENPKKLSAEVASGGESTGNEETKFSPLGGEVCSCLISLLNGIRAWGRSRSSSGVILPSPTCCSSSGGRNVVIGGKGLSCPHEHVLAHMAEQWSNTSSDGFEQTLRQLYIIPGTSSRTQVAQRKPKPGAKSGAYRLSQSLRKDKREEDGSIFFFGFVECNFKEVVIKVERGGIKFKVGALTHALIFERRRGIRDSFKRCMG